MKRILNIFRKDARRLWPQTSIFCALLAANAWAVRWYPHNAPSRVPVSFLLFLLLPLACSVLLIALIHEERLVGDRQYWLSRPIQRRELIAAKILFSLIFVNLPVLVYQAVTAVTGGLPLLRNWSNFLWLQLLFTAISVLPIVALASVTKSMVQAVLAALAAVAAAAEVIAWSASVVFDPSLVWVEVSFWAAVLTVGSALVLLRQYYRRGVWLSRILLASTVALAACAGILPHSARWAIQVKRSHENVDPSAFRISLSQDRRLNGRGRPIPDQGPVSLEFPIDIAQPAGVSVHAEAFRAIAVSPTGESWHSSWNIDWSSSDDGIHRMTVTIDRAFYNRVKDAPVHFYGDMHLTILANGPTIPLPGRHMVEVPGIGICATALQDELRIFCNSLLPSARIQLMVNGHPEDASPSIMSPYPYSAGYSPITAVELVIHDHPDRVGLMIQKPIAYIQRPFDFGNIVLAGYQVAYDRVAYLP